MTKRLEEKVRHIQLFSLRKMLSRDLFTQRKGDFFRADTFRVEVGDF